MMAGLPAGLLERALAAAVARARADSPRACELISALAGRRIAVEAQGTPCAVTLASTGSGLRLEARGADDVLDARISGTPLALLALARAPPGTALPGAAVRIEGDGELAQRFAELARLLRPDLEHLLAGVLGRPLAHLSARAFRATRAWARASAWSAAQALADYLAHESRELVSRAESEHFLRGVDDLREQSDRIGARISRLEAERLA
jgi:ubiquinone biosynthesis protein UbiJ